MTARRFLYHLGKAYRYYHPDALPKPQLFENLQKTLLASRLERIEKRCEQILEKKHSEQVELLLQRVRELKASNVTAH